MKSTLLKCTSVALLTGALGLVGCSTVHKTGETSAMDRVSPVSPEAKVSAAKADASFVTEVSFEPGSATLSEDAKERLNQVVNQARATGEIDDIKVISWADMDYPSASAKTLPKQQRDLAERRAEEIRRHLRASDASLDVDAVNMTKRPNALARWVGTEDARIKRSLETAGIPNTDSPDVLASKVGKAMVMVLLED